MKNDIIDLAAMRNRKSNWQKAVYMCESMWKKLHKEPEPKPMATRVRRPDNDPKGVA